MIDCNMDLFNSSCDLPVSVASLYCIHKFSPTAWWDSKVSLENCPLFYEYCDI